MSTHRPGAIVWRELLTTDQARATAFYTELFGWKTRDMDMGPMGVYRMFLAGEQQVGGSMQIQPPMPPMPTMWMQYLSVADVDAAAAKIPGLGGQVLRAPDDIPNVGRFALCQDPQGAIFNVFRDLRGDAPAAMPALGTFCWESLNTTDKQGACAFYAALAPYEVKDFHGNVTLGIQGESMGGVADVGDAPPGVPPHWLSHVAVKSLAESLARVTALGGKVLMGEITIPETGVMGVVQDPTGGTISLFEPRMG